MQAGVVEFREKRLKDEEQFFLSLIALAQGQDISLTEENPYYPYLDEFLGTLDQGTPSALFETAFAQALSTRDKHSLREQVWLLGAHAILAGEHELESKLRGIYEYLGGISVKEAQNEPGIDIKTVEVMQDLYQAAIEES